MTRCEPQFWSEADAMTSGIENAHARWRDGPLAIPATPRWVRLVLIVAAFSLPWSSDMSGNLGAFVSRIFNVCQVLLVLYWATSIPRPFASLPRSFALFVLFVSLHTVVTYGLLHPGDLFRSDYEAALGVEVIEAVPRAVVVIKIGLFFMLGFAIAAIADGAEDLKRLGFAMGASLALLMLIGGGAVHADLGDRFAGGYANPNAFAEVCAAVLFLNFHAVFARSGSPFERVVGLGLAAIAIAGLLLSASRSSAAGVLVGVAAMVVASGARRGLLLASVGALLVGIVAVATSGSVFEALYRRTTESVVDLRSLIWSAYIRQWRDYILLGVGLGREMTVLDSTIFVGRIWPPHNTLLQTAVAYGILGPTLLVAFLASGIHRAWQAARQQRKMSGPTVALGVLCCWAVLMLMGDRLGARIFWMMLGAVFAVLNRGRDAAGGNTETESSWR